MTNHANFRRVDDLNLHIRKMLAHYPELFKTRLDVLHHIFIVSGTGFFWGEDGSLYDIEWDDYDTPPLDKMPEKDYLNDYPYPSLGIADHIPDNAPEDIRAAALEILNVWRSARKYLYDC